MRRFLTPLEADRVRADLARGMPPGVIAKLMHVDRRKVEAIARETMRERARTAPVTTEEAQAIFELSDAGTRHLEIAHRVNRSVSTIRRIIALGRDGYVARAARIDAENDGAAHRSAGLSAALDHAEFVAAIRPRHVTAAIWSDEWFEQQHKAFAAAFAAAMLAAGDRQSEGEAYLAAAESASVGVE